MTRQSSGTTALAPPRARRLLHLAAYLLPVLVVLAGLPLYVLPAVDDPRHVDVVFVLGSPDAWRIRLAQQLVAEGRADAILISVPSGKEEPGTCASIGEPLVTCVTPRPSTTDGEARVLRAELSEHGWRTVLAVTSTPHITRARLILRQCVPVGVGVTGRSEGVDLGEWMRQYLYQTAALVKAVVVPAC